MDYLIVMAMTSMLWGIVYLLIERNKLIKRVGGEIEKPTEEEEREIKRREEHLNSLLEYDVSKAYGVKR
jgi:hypothetical protein